MCYFIWMTYQHDPKKYFVANCNPYGVELKRDITKFVTFTINIKGMETWTYSEWFFFNIPVYILFRWIEDNEEKLNTIDYDLIIILNNGNQKIIQRTDNILLKDVCASHIVEIICINKKQKIYVNNKK